MEKFFALFISVISALFMVSCENLQETDYREQSDETTQISEKNEQEESDLNKIKITAGGKNFTAVLYDTEAAAAFEKMLPMTLDMSELNGNEKYFYLSEDLPTNSEHPEKINTGDIMLFGSSCIVLFYDSFNTSYSYTKIGCIDDTAGLSEALGNGNVTVEFAASTASQ